MKQFDLETYLTNPQRKVVTRRGNHVRIICTDRKHGNDNLPIVFLEKYNDCDGEFLSACGSDGRGDKYDTPFDLFFADEGAKKPNLVEELKDYFEKTPKEQVEKDFQEIEDWCEKHGIATARHKNEEEELSEFEKEIQKWMNEYLLGTEQPIPNDAVKKASNKILYIVRRQGLLEANGAVRKDVLEEVKGWLSERLQWCLNNQTTKMVSHSNAIAYYMEGLVELFDERFMEGDKK